ncbi:MAG: MATE family efflux transporter [Saezia sp.]
MTKNHTAFHDLSTQKVSSLFWRYALPSVIGATVNPLYNIINGVFIGHWIGQDALSATGAILPVMNLAAAIGMMIGVGSATRMSLYLGNNDLYKAERIVGTSFLLSLLLSGVAIALLLLFLKPVLMFSGATETTYPYARDFLVIFLPGSIFLTLAFNYNNMMRASGFPTKAMITMFISVIANILLAPIFIYVLGWGMKGAAIATTISMAISFVFVMQHFMNKNSPHPVTQSQYSLGLGEC